MELTWIDKSTWGPGPWQDESDKISWTDEATGLPCLIVRGPAGALCGYVGVAPGHPLHKVEYMDMEVDLEVHGSVTFTGGCQEEDAEHGICHVPEPGQPDDVWWIGFDCAHAFDVTPRIDADLRDAGLPPTSLLEASMYRSAARYRDVGYVKAQCADLARQLRDQEGK